MYYNVIAAGYDELHLEEQKRKLKTLLSKLEVRSNDFVLDVGCGSGAAFENPAFKNCPVLLGIDPSDGLIQKARSRGADVAVAKGEWLPFRDHTFDLVVSLTAIHHCSEPDLVLQEILRVGGDRFGVTLLKRSANVEKTQRFIEAIERLFVVDACLEDQHDHIFVLRRKPS